MNNLIDSRFVKVDEPEKCGLPNVIGRLNINCKDSSDCKDLVDKIYNLVDSCVVSGEAYITITLMQVFPHNLKWP
jgi:hypothetical protein